MRTVLVAGLVMLQLQCAEAMSYRCKLAPAQCQRVMAEILQEIEAEHSDAMVFRDWSPGERFRRIQDRKAARLRRTVARLPSDIGNEMVRLLLCESSQALAAARKQVFDDPSCLN